MLIELTAPHEHAGTRHQTGAIIDLPPQDAAYVLSIGAAKKTTEPRQQKRNEPTTLENE